MKKTLFLMGAVLTVVMCSGCGQGSGQSTSLDSDNMAPGSATAATTEINIEAAGTAAAPQLATADSSAGAGAVEAPMEQASLAVSAKPSVQEIQRALKNVGLYKGEVDGDLGPRTRRAIEYFQSQNNLVVDGKVGPKTWSKLSGYLNQEPTPDMAATENTY